MEAHQPTKVSVTDKDSAVPCGQVLPVEQPVHSGSAAGDNGGY